MCLLEINGSTIFIKAFSVKKLGNFGDLSPPYVKIIVDLTGIIPKWGYDVPPKWQFFQFEVLNWNN
jgi:hypothetical protein